MPTIVTKTIGSGRDYASISAWLDGANSTYPSGLVSADVVWKGVLYAEGGGTNGEWSITSDKAITTTCDDTRYLWLTAATGASFTDNANKLTNALRYNNANGVAISSSANATGTFDSSSVGNSQKLVLTGIQLKATAASYLFYWPNGKLFLESCIVLTDSSAAFYGCCSAVNSLFTIAATYPVGNNLGIGTACYYRNCNFITTGATSNAINIGAYAATNQIIKNCTFFGFSAVRNDPSSKLDTTNSSHNVTDLSSFGWTATGNLVSKTLANQFQNTGSGTEDFRAKSGNDLGAGTRDQTYTNDLDIVSQSRSTTTPTIGAWEFLSLPAAPTGVTAGSVTAYAVTASWTDASSDETGFKVQYAPSPYSSWTAFSGSPAAANATSLASGNVLTPGTSYKIRVASTNANGDSAFVESGVFTTTPLTFLRPIADTSNGAWTASSGSDRFAMIDESTTNDSDYITVSSASTYKARLTTVSDPGVDTDHSVVVRAKGDGSSQLTIALVQGDPTETAIASTTVTPTTSYANYTLTVTSGQAANITDYSLLYLKLTSL